MRPRENPFSTEKVSQLRYRLDCSHDELLQRLHELGSRVSIIGMHGNGKSTLIEDVEQHMLDRGLAVIRMLVNQASPRVPRSFWTSSVKNSYVILDGVERLNPLHWMAFQLKCREAAGVIIVEHFKGRWPVLYECQTGSALFIELAYDLLNPELRAFAPPSYLEELFVANSGNLRDCFRVLYDRFADLELTEIAAHGC
jgi:hypothetical protein